MLSNTLKIFGGVLVMVGAVGAGVFAAKTLNAPAVVEAPVATPTPIGPPDADVEIPKFVAPAEPVPVEPTLAVPTDPVESTSQTPAAEAPAALEAETVDATAVETVPATPETVSDTPAETFILPALENHATEQDVITGLAAQGYADVSVTTQNGNYIVRAVRNDYETELVFSEGNGELLFVDGIRPADGWPHLFAQPEAESSEGAPIDMEEPSEAQN